MCRVRFLHAADIHLDAPFQSTSSFSKEWIDRLQQASWDAFDNLLNLAVKENVDFVILAGDIFDKQGYSPEGKEKFIRKMLSFTSYQIHTYIISGNHDIYMDANELASIFHDNPYIHVFSSDKVEIFPFYKKGEVVAKVYGRGFWDADVEENPVSPYVTAVHGDESDVLKIAVAHGRVGKINEFLPCASFGLGDMKRSPFHYWAMGHVHKRKIHIDEVPFVVNPGIIQGTNIDEPNAMGCYIVEWNEQRLENMQFFSLESVLWEKSIFHFQDENFSVGISKEEVIDQIKKHLHQRYGEMEKPMIVQLILRGRTGAYPLLRTHDFLGQVKDHVSDERVLVLDIEEQTTPLTQIEEVTERFPLLKKYFSILESAKLEDERFSELDCYLQSLYSDPTFQKLTETGPNQRGRGQWKIKKVKNEWLGWLDEAKKIGFDSFYFMNAGEVIIDEILDQLSQLQERYFSHHHNNGQIQRLMEEYEQLSESCDHTSIKEMVNLQRQKNQVDVELFAAVKKWTQYTMAKWAFEKVTHKYVWQKNENEMLTFL